MGKIVWTELSRDNLENIFTYIAEDSKTYASITVNKIYLKAQKIPSNPYSGRVVPEFSDEQIREIIVGNYRIIYRLIHESQIHILRVFHSSRLLRKEKLN